MILAFFIITIFQGLVIGLMILNSPFFKGQSNRYLGLAILSLSFSFLNLVFDDYTDLYIRFPILCFIDILDPGILFPVLLFLFVSHQVNRSVKKKLRIALILPYIIIVVRDCLEVIEAFYRIPFFVKIIIIIFSFIEFSFVISIPFVLGSTYRFIKYAKNHEEKKWLHRLWFFVTLFFVSWVITFLLGMVLDAEYTYFTTILALLAALLVHWIAYFGVYKFRLSNEKEDIRKLLKKLKHTNINLDKENLKLEKEVKKGVGGLSQDNIYFEKLKKLCVQEQVYLDHTLDRKKIAEKLGISSGYVSQLVNTITGENFSTFINQYRVEEVKRMLLNSDFDNYSLLAIGLESGFSSKTTFHNTFKKITGMTPNAYKKAYKKVPIS